MTQHLLEQHTQEDVDTLRRLRNMVAGFVLFTAALALSVTYLAS